MRCYIAMSCRMSLKVFFSDFHQDFFTDIFGGGFDEAGEIFHQDTIPTQKLYHGFENKITLTDDCWTLYLYQLDQEHRRKSKSQCFQLWWSNIDSFIRPNIVYSFFVERQ